MTFKNILEKRKILFTIGVIIGLLVGVSIGLVISQFAVQSNILTLVKTSNVTATFFSTIIKTITTTKLQEITITFIPTSETLTLSRQGYSIKVMDVIADDVSDINYVYYILGLEARYLGPSEWVFNWANLKLSSNSGYTYNPFYCLAVREPMPAGVIKSGEAFRGQVAFKLPKNEVPIKLSYDDPIGIHFEVGEIPQPSKEVSYLYSATVEISSDVSVIFGTADITTLPPIYYSGENIRVKLEIDYEKTPGSPETIEIRSIDTTPFILTDTTPTLPINLSSGQKVIINLNLKAPTDGYGGALKIRITATSKEETDLTTIRPGVKIVNAERKDKPNGYAIAYISGTCGEDFRLISPKNAKYWRVTITMVSSIEQPIHIHIVEVKGEYPYDWQHQNLPEESGWKTASLTVYLDPSKNYEIWIRDAYAKPFTGIIEEEWWS